MLITSIEAISYKYKTKIPGTTKPVKPQIYVCMKHTWKKDSPAFMVVLTLTCREKYLYPPRWACSLKILFEKTGVKLKIPFSIWSIWSNWTIWTALTQDTLTLWETIWKSPSQIENCRLNLINLIKLKHLNSPHARTR